MKRRIIALVLILCLILSLCGCFESGGISGFSITFIDVGQGDSALVACDGHYMLIDGGDAAAGEKVCDVLKENGVKRLDILVASHLHDDHIGGLIEVLDQLQSVKLVLSNAKNYTSRTFDKFHNRLVRHRTEIKVPTSDSTYQLGSANIQILSVQAQNENDSLVLMITYGENTFLFAGDMEQNQERQICDHYGDERQDITLLKVAHHGADTSTSIRFLRTVMPKYAVISVGKGNQYGHPSKETLEKLEQAGTTVYRTDINGTIIVTSNGEKLKIDEYSAQDCAPRPPELSIHSGGIE